jgi:hypothetical protein
MQNVANLENELLINRYGKKWIKKYSVIVKIYLLLWMGPRGIYILSQKSPRKIMNLIK